MMSSVYSLTMLSNNLMQSSSSLIRLNDVMFSKKFRKYLKMQSICVFRTFFCSSIWTCPDSSAACSLFGF